MKFKTSEATGAVLDWLVATCEGHVWRCPWILQKEGAAAWRGYEEAWGNPTPGYSTNWSQGGPIIDRECIGTWPPDEDHPHWTAGKQGVPKATRGPTLLIAAMRCFCCSKLGDEVNIPEELCQQQNS